MIDPGQMRTRLLYQEPHESTDAGGGSVKTWLDRFKVWARVRPVQGDEAIRNDQTVAEVRYEVVCRHRPGIAPPGRFVVVGTNRILNVQAVVDWEMRGVELTVTCSERIEAVV